MSAQADSDGEQAQQQPKKLRFITNHGAPNPKRRRIGAACLTCRKRKTACSGERPACETCKQNKLDCAGYSAESASGSGAAAHKRTYSDAGGRRPTEQDRRLKQEADQARQRAFSLSVHEIDLNKPIYQTPSAASVFTYNADVRSPASARAGASAEQKEDGSAMQEPLFSGPRNRMPYFRWLGPTAIMPGFKQMVVKVKRRDTTGARSSSDGGMLSPSLTNLNAPDRVASIYSATPAAVESDMRTPLNLPFYDTSTMPPSELITHLCTTFFTHLGCNYPFLQQDRFMKDLEEKQVDAILVDAVCALAARYSTHSLLVQQASDDSKTTPADYGHAFAHRAKAALVDTFACPSVAAAQAALLLAYNEFGESRDSGLWMYLGIAIRLAEDLGMHKLQGLRYEGRGGPTPRMVKMGIAESNRAAMPIVDQPMRDQIASDEQRAVERERVDTFWAIFFLDRVVSSGTGRRSTLRDKDIELSFPCLDVSDAKTGWPAPFPALIRIVHLYGRVADLLNSIKEPSDITSDTTKRLAAMESQVTSFYQGLSPRLHFDAFNFQYYVKAGEGTNFVLLHFWFHTLIVLLHQPTLLKTFEGKMLQLFPNSQQLSMSSAKTIADILSYSQLIDAKASLGNPFTTQPIYIAACAFLKETAEQTATSNEQSRAQSRASSPAQDDTIAEKTSSLDGTPQNGKKSSASSSSNGKLTPNAKDDKQTLARHTLLATAANQHYQLCYKALQSLETYWSGTKYILTVLDQKFEGVGDPLLYTVEEGECAMEQPKPEPAFTSPGWRRKLSLTQYSQLGNGLPMQSPFLRARGLGKVPGSPSVDPTIGWTLTGTMNSPSTNLAWHYPTGAGPTLPRFKSLQPSDYDVSTMKVAGEETKPAMQYPQQLRVAPGSHSNPTNMTRPSIQTYPITPSNVSTSDADLLLGLNSPYANGTPRDPNIDPYLTTTSQRLPSIDAYGSVHGNTGMPDYSSFMPNTQNFGDMMIESQDVDMSMLGLDMMPWFDSYPTHDMMAMFDPGGESLQGAGQQSELPHEAQ